VADRTGWWWWQLSDGADLVEEPDGTFTWADPPDPAVEVRADLTDAVILAAVLAELRRRGYTITGPG
jgi:hypothetical protein